MSQILGYKSEKPTDPFWFFARIGFPGDEQNRTVDFDEATSDDVTYWGTTWVDGWNVICIPLQSFKCFGFSESRYWDPVINQTLRQFSKQGVSFALVFDLATSTFGTLVYSDRELVRSHATNSGQQVEDYRLLLDAEIRVDDFDDLEKLPTVLDSLSFPFQSLRSAKFSTHAIEPNSVQQDHYRRTDIDFVRRFIKRDEDGTWWFYREERGVPFTRQFLDCNSEEEVMELLKEQFHHDDLESIDFCLSQMCWDAESGRWGYVM